MKKRLLVLLPIALLSTVLLQIFIILTGVSATHEYLVTKYYRFENLGCEAIIQEFTPKYGRLLSIEVFFANIYAETEGNIKLEIVDGDGKYIFKKQYKASSFPTGEFSQIRINRKVKRDNLYRILLSYDGSSAEIPQVMVSEREKNLIETGKMFVGNKTNDYNMAITYHYKER